MNLQFNNIALITAAGIGKRFSPSYPKGFYEIAGKPLICHAIDHFLSHPFIDGVKCIIAPDMMNAYEDAIGERIADPKLLSPAMGGEERQDSIKNGLLDLSANPPKNILIHDGARPLITHGLIDRILAGLNHYQGVIPTQISHNSLHQLDTQDEELSAPKLLKAIDRSKVIMSQTPQGFHYQSILNAYHSSSAQNIHTDDAALALASGLNVIAVEGDARNIKLTTPDDQIIIEAFLSDTEQSSSALMQLRTGIGFDVHCFGGNSPLRICGCDIPFHTGLAGHSDADVALHAICDALYGAMGLGDIGVHFPPSSNQWKDVDSTQFLAHAMEQLRQRCGILINLDLTIIGEEPKINPHRDMILEKLSELLSLPKDRIGLKATTTEKLGFLGRKEGLAAQAQVLIKL